MNILQKETWIKEMQHHQDVVMWLTALADCKRKYYNEQRR
jgi:hypothetical protein